MPQHYDTFGGAALGSIGQALTQLPQVVQAQRQQQLNAVLTQLNAMIALQQQQQAKASAAADMARLASITRLNDLKAQQALLDLQNYMTPEQKMRLQAEIEGRQKQLLAGQELNQTLQAYREFFTGPAFEQVAQAAQQAGVTSIPSPFGGSITLPEPGGGGGDLSGRDKFLYEYYRQRYGDERATEMLAKIFAESKTQGPEGKYFQLIKAWMNKPFNVHTNFAAFVEDFENNSRIAAKVSGWLPQYGMTVEAARRRLISSRSAGTLSEDEFQAAWNELNEYLAEDIRPEEFEERYGL